MGTQVRRGEEVRRGTGDVVGDGIESTGEVRRIGPEVGGGDHVGKELKQALSLEGCGGEAVTPTVAGGVVGFDEGDGIVGDPRGEEEG